MNIFRNYLISVVFFTFVFSSLNSAAIKDEGMWIPSLIEKLNEAQMKKLGMQISADKIYSEEKPSIKDAIVGLGSISNTFGGFYCTGEIVSSKGLILTNHHCAYDAIQSLSSIEKDYLTNGFWALRIEEELPIKNMSVSILQRIEDVTSKVFAGLDENMSIQSRNEHIENVISKIESEAAENGKFIAHVSEKFYGSEYYLYVYQSFNDVRLVGAPPTSIGKFGGDTDNWMWPRHTGDFTFLRVYTAPDGSPATYNKENIPMKPKHYLPISIQGVEKNDFAMIFGFPGTTNRFLTSYGIENQLTHKNPNIIKIRDTKLNVMRSFMDSNEEIRIQYAAKYAQTANYWKYFIGQTKGLNKHDVYQRRKNLEEEFQKWVNQDENNFEIYGSVLKDIRESYIELDKTSKLEVYLQEAVFQGPEFLVFSFGIIPLFNTLAQQQEAKRADKAIFNKQIIELSQDFKLGVNAHFKNYNAELDKELFIQLIELMYQNIASEQHPKIFEIINNKYKGNIRNWANDIYSNSIFVDKNKLIEFLNNPSYRKISRDPGWEVTMSMINSVRRFFMQRVLIENKLENAMKLFVQGLREMKPEKVFYPNANSTLRMSYGKVLDYYPADAVHYNYFTTALGILEKKDPNNEEFIVPEKLYNLIKNKDFGRYGKNGVLNVCFITNNDITGGNSGSPVINANGHLIGIAFDGNWESMSGDIQYEPSVQRTINVDIRYVLFITEKFAGAKNIIDELTIID